MKFNQQPFWALLFLILFVVAGYGFFNMARQAVYIGGEVRESRRKIEELTRRRAELEAYLAELGTSEAAQREAKDRLGLKLPGEEVVVVVEEQSATASLEEVGPGLWERVKKFLGIQ